jgi:putative ABC transport system substrate-binding protein
MNRRELMLLLGGALTVARGLRAQQKAMPVIGFLGSIGPIAPQMDAFHHGLSETGYVEGQNVTVEYRWAGEAMIGCPHWPPISSAARLI